MFDRVVIKPQSGKYILIYELKIQFVSQQIFICLKSTPETP